VNDHKVILTCRDCEQPSPRPLPYNMAAPDQCDHCSRPFRTRFDILRLDFQLWRKQSKTASAVEAVVNTFVGLAIAFAAQSFICWVYGIELSNEDNFIIVSWMTAISVLRSYAIRRAWNSEFWRRKRG